MTYTYILTLPLVLVYGLGNSIIKYQEGFVLHPELGVIPKPYMYWTPAHQDAIFPLMITFSIAWSFEMITHLEELCFWLFLINANSSQQDWFKSLYFRVWAVGSVVAIVYVPLITIFSRSDPLKSEAFTFLAGSLGSLSITLWFMPILWTFPSFLKNLENQGVDEGTIVRLTTFHELNKIRVFFRMLFVVPFVILGVDGVRPHKHVNESMFGTDFLGILAAFGCGISSAMTLVIFFPRTISGEYRARKAKRQEREKQIQHGQTQQTEEPAMLVLTDTTGSLPGTKQTLSFASADEDEEDIANNTYEMPPTYSKNPNPNPWTHVRNQSSLSGTDRGESAMDWSSPITVGTSGDAPLRPNRRVDYDEEANAESDGRTVESPGRRSQMSNLSKSKWVHPFLKNFRTPIDLANRHKKP